MSNFYLPAGFMVVIAALFVVVPMLKYHRHAISSRSSMRLQENRSLYRQRLTELSQDMDSGIIEPKEYRDMKTELQRTFLHDMDALEALKTTPVALRSTKDITFPLSILGFVILFSLWMYSRVGAAGELGIPQLIENINDPASQEMLDADYRELAYLLSVRLGKRPNDLSNAYMLGTLYLRLKRYPEAISTLTDLSEKVTNEHDKLMVLQLIARAESSKKSTLPAGHPDISIDENSTTSRILLQVTIADEIRENITEDMQLFVFARDSSRNIPLAVATYELDAIPELIILDDSMAMMPQAKISSADTIFVGARIANDATGSNGGFLAESETFTLAENNQLVRLTVSDAEP